MSQTLGSITLPAGLRWEDELLWSDKDQAISYSLDGALFVGPSSKQAGRPITLRGGKSFTWISRSDLSTLMAAIDAASESGQLLTLYDARAFLVIGRYESGKHPVEAYPLPVVMDSGPADPDEDSLYYIEAIRLIVIGV